MVEHAGRGDETEATVLGAQIEQIAMDEGDRAEPQFGRIALRVSETGAAEVDSGDREAGVGARVIDRLLTSAAAGDAGPKRGGGSRGAVDSGQGCDQNAQGRRARR